MIFHDNLIKTKQLIEKMSHAELKEIMIYLIKCFDYQQSSEVLID